jgi:hypothetical protein
VIPLVVLLTWIGVGLALAVRTAQPGEPKLAWAPVAVILGPLWAPVALDRRMIADDEREALRRP